MANIYVNSTTGDNSNNGNSWATAKANLTGAVSIMASGDTIFMAPEHRESTPSGLSFTLQGTSSSPAKVVCATTAATPPTEVSTGARITTTNTSPIVVVGFGYVQGIDFYVATGTTLSSMQMNSGTGAVTQTYKDCNFVIGSSAEGLAINLGNSSATLVQNFVLKNCGISFKNAGQYILCTHALWEGGRVLAGSATPTSAGMFKLGTRGGIVEVKGWDFTQCTAGLILADFANGCGTITFSNCKLPTGWTGQITANTVISPGQRAKVVNCDSGDTNYKMMISDFYGDITVDTTVVRSGGATDGTTPISWKMVSKSNTNYPTNYLSSEEILRWFPATDIGEQLNTPVNFGVEIISDSAANLNNDEVWVEAQVFSTSGAPLGTFVSGSKTDFLQASAAQPVSSELWAASTLTAPKRQSLRVTVTPREAGWVSLKVCLAKPSTTIYVCPKVRVG